MYPVIERTDQPNSLLGSPCQKGYNSHYVLVRNNDPTQALNYQPCNPETDVAEYDEVVVFDKDQVLPRYLVYYTRMESDELKSLHKSCVLWVDCNDNSKSIAELQREGVRVITFPNSSALRHWLTLNESVARDPKTPLRVISNRNRPGDGDESAGVRLLQWLHHEGSEWNFVPFLLFCGDTKRVKDMPSKNNCFLTDTNAGLKIFALEGRL